MNYKEFTLEDTIRDAIITVAEKLTGTPEETAPFLANYIRSLLPEDITEALQDIHSQGNIPLVLLHNLPIDRNIPALRSDITERLREKGQVSQRVILALSYLMGAVVIANPKEQNGKLIHDVAPNPATFETRSSVGLEPLDPHTESPQEDNPPHYLLLLGLKGDSHAKTVFFSIADIFNHLSPDIIDLLKEPLYEIRSGASYTNGITKSVRPIIDETTGKPVLHYIKDASRVVALNDNAALALDALNAAIERGAQEERVEVTVQAGDAVIFNNGSLENGVMHARAGRIEDVSRWLQRGFLYKDNEIYKQANSSYLIRTIDQELHSNRIVPAKVVATTLREVMVNTDSVIAYKTMNPNASLSQAVLYGLEAKKTSGSWVERISKEAVSVTAHKDALKNGERGKMNFMTL